VPNSNAIPPELLSATSGLRDPWSLAGCWSGGERFLTVGKRPIAVNVWFHLFEGGETILSLRARDQQQPNRVHGRWWVEPGLLVVAFGSVTIRAAFTLDDDVLQWAGETLVRLPDRTASMAFGICLPYRLGHLDTLRPESV
jgi:hypothetical protein